MAARSWPGRIGPRLVFFVLLLCALGFMFRWFEHRQVYIPSRVLEVNAHQLGAPCEEVWLEASDGVRLHGWFFPATAGSRRSNRVFLLFHGNAGNLSQRAPYYRALLETGLNVFSFDYRGYGRSAGRPSEEGTYLDGRAAVGWLRGRGFASTNILLLGKSLGGGVASQVALSEDVGGLILQNTFQSIPHLGKELFPFLPVSSLASIHYDTQAKLPSIKIPVLVLHSRKDEIVGFHHAAQNYSAANEPKMFWELDGGHNTTLEYGKARYLEGLETFLERYFP